MVMVDRVTVCFKNRSIMSAGHGLFLDQIDLSVFFFNLLKEMAQSVVYLFRLGFSKDEDVLQK